MNNEDMRIGDTEREVAISALGEHMSAGRLNIDEYGERSAKVTAAKTRGELSSLFSDLPQPQPTFGAGPTTATPPSAPAPPPAQRPNSQVTKVFAGLLPVVVIAAIVLFAATHIGIWFVLIPLFLVFGGGFRHRERRMYRADYRMDRHRDRIERHMDRMDSRWRRP